MLFLIKGRVINVGGSDREYIKSTVSHFEFSHHHHSFQLPLSQSQASMLFSSYGSVVDAHFKPHHQFLHRRLAKMQFKAKIVTLATLLAAAAHGVPTAGQTPDSAHEAVSTLARRNNCLDSTFKNLGSSSAHLISSCQRISSNIAGGGDWNCLGWNTKILTSGTCAFHCVPFAPQGSTIIHHDDVRDLIGDSIAKFKRSVGRVAAEW